MNCKQCGSGHLPGETEENLKNFSPSSHPKGQDLNMGPPEYKSEV
jgi:hypothetical protein